MDGTCRLQYDPAPETPSQTKSPRLQGVSLFLIYQKNIFQTQVAVSHLQRPGPSESVTPLCQTDEQATAAKKSARTAARGEAGPQDTLRVDVFHSSKH